MRYLGGKAKIAKELVKFLNSQLEAGQSYYEPFCGAGWVFSGIVSKRIFASDMHQDLIELWSAIKSGWIPPETLSREDYQQLKDAPSSALRGFAGFGCSFSGKWFGGYASDSSGRNYAKNAKNSILSKAGNILYVEFLNLKYSEVKITPGSLVYCDPPYYGTTQYSGEKFDSVKFWQWVREVSKHSRVLVSEYTAPSDFKVVWQQLTKTDMKTNGDNVRLEKVFSL